MTNIMSKIFRRFLKKEEPKPEVKVQSTAKPYELSSFMWHVDQETTSLGRNGEMKCLGIHLAPSRVVNKENNKKSFDMVIISPLNSKGNIGRSNICIPKRSIPGVIAELETYYNSVGDGRN